MLASSRLQATLFRTKVSFSKTKRFDFATSRRSSLCERLLGQLLPTTAAALCLAFNGARADVVVVPEDELPSAVIGAQVRDLNHLAAAYLGNAERVHLRLLQVRKQLDACNGCAQQSSLQAEYDGLVKQEEDRKKVEGMALHAYGLPYKDFSDVLEAAKNEPYRSPNPALAQRLSEAKWNAGLNYCYITNGGDLDNAMACRAVFDTSKAEATVQSVAQACRDKVAGQTKVTTFDEIPPPSAPAAEFAALKDAWRKVDACRQNSDIYQYIQHEAARLCKTDSIASTADLKTFACACQGIAKPAAFSNCPAHPPEATKIPELVHEHPVGHIVNTDPGPELLGIHLLMPMDDAEKLVLKHMRVARTAAIGQPVHGPGMMAQQLEYQTSGLSGKWLMSQDGNEYVFLFGAPQHIPGRVLQVARVRLLSSAALKAAEDDVHRTRGQSTNVPGLTDEYYGKGNPALCTGRSPSDPRFWVDEQTGWQVATNNNDPRDRSDDRLGLLMTIKLPKLPARPPLPGVSECGPLLDVFYGGNPGDPMHTGHPMWVVESLYDLGLTQWATRSPFTGSREVALRPVPPSFGPVMPAPSVVQAASVPAAKPSVAAVSQSQTLAAVNPTPPRAAAGPNRQEGNPDACKGDDTAKLACLHLYRAQEDARLNDVYRTTMAKLDNDGKNRLRLAEREWIKERDQKCRPPGNGAPQSQQAREDWMKCLADETIKRTAVLAAYE